MTSYNSIWEVIKLWFHSADFNKYDTLYGYKFLWLSRFGQAFRFIAGLTIIADIIGQEKIKQYKEKTNGIIKLKEAFNLLFLTSRFRYLHRGFKSVGIESSKEIPPEGKKFLSVLMKSVLLLSFIIHIIKVTIL